MNAAKQTAFRFLTASGAVALVAVLLVSASSARAQDMASQPRSYESGPSARPPAGSIKSTEEANRALSESEAERARIEKNYAERTNGCYSKFFVTACTDEAKEQRRIDLARIRSVEIEANAFLRRARAEERDRALAEKRVEDQADEARRTQNQKEREARQSTERKPSAETPTSAPAPEAKTGTGRTADSQRKSGKTVKEPHPSARRTPRERTAKEETDEAKQREENIAAYEKKVKEAQEHQREVAARKAEKAKKRAEKAQTTQAR